MNSRTVSVMIMCAATVVESCRSINPMRQDFTEKCGDWWAEAGTYDEHRNRDIVKCVELVRSKCPGTVTTSEGKVNKQIMKYYTLWEVETIATYSRAQATVTYTAEQKRRVCGDEDGGPGDCEFWWQAATWKDTDNSMVDWCVSQVLKNCPGLLSLLEDRTETKLHRGDYLNLQHLTYQHRGGQQVSFRRYHYRFLDRQRKAPPPA